MDNVAVSRADAGLFSRLAEAYSVRRNYRQLVQAPAANVPFLDGLRALSVLNVIIFHTLAGLGVIHGYVFVFQVLDGTPWWFRWAWQGPLAVDVFFVLSGFLIGSMLLRELGDRGNIDLPRFYLRRFLRLTPVYWLTIFTARLLVRDPEGNIQYSFEQALPIYLYVQNFLPSKQSFVGWTWSLAVEEQFYLVMPMLLLLVYRRLSSKWLLFATLFAVSLLVRATVLHNNDYFVAFLEQPNQRTDASPLLVDSWFDTLYDNLYTHFGPLLAGFTVAHLQTRHSARLTEFFARRVAPALGLVGAFAIIALAYSIIIPDARQDYSQLGNALILVCSHDVFGAAIAYLVLCFSYSYGPSQLLNRALSWGRWYPIAQLSYSMYLVHMIVIVALMFILKAPLTELIAQGQFNALHVIGLASVATVISALVALVLFFVVERPIMNLRPRSTKIDDHRAARGVAAMADSTAQVPHSIARVEMRGAGREHNQEPSHGA